MTSAARAIGQATAVVLAKAGADVALFDIAVPDAIAHLGCLLASRAELDESASLVAATGRRATPIVADVRSFEAMQNPVTHIEEAFGRTLDIFVANAALVPAASLTEITSVE